MTSAQCGQVCTLVAAADGLQPLGGDAQGVGHSQPHGVGAHVKGEDAPGKPGLAVYGLGVVRIHGASIAGRRAEEMKSAGHAVGFHSAAAELAGR